MAEHLAGHTPDGAEVYARPLMVLGRCIVCGHEDYYPEDTPRKDADSGRRLTEAEHTTRELKYAADGAYAGVCGTHTDDAECVAAFRLAHATGTIREVEA